MYHFQNFGQKYKRGYFRTTSFSNRTYYSIPYSTLEMSNAIFDTLYYFMSIYNLHPPCFKTTISFVHMYIATPTTHYPPRGRCRGCKAGKANRGRMLAGFNATESRGRGSGAVCECARRSACEHSKMEVSSRGE
jgi:hypothetical protein